MTEVICIGAESPLDGIEERIQQELSFLEADGIELSMELSRSRFFNFLRCNISFPHSKLSTEEQRARSRTYIANALSDVLVNQWQQNILQRLLRRHFDCFSEGEQQEIVRLAIERLAALSDGDKASVYLESRKSQVRQALSDYLSKEDRVNLDGFLNFRLKGYCVELEECIYDAVDKHLSEKENQEFIRLLRHFVEIIEPKYDLVHVLLTSMSEFEILDEDGDLLQSDLLETVVMGEIDNIPSYEDVLISALLSISPRELVVHEGTFSSNPAVLATICGVFQNRITHCSDCDVCKDATRKHT